MLVTHRERKNKMFMGVPYVLITFPSLGSRAVVLRTEPKKCWFVPTSIDSIKACPW